METEIEIYLPDNMISGIITCLPKQRLLDRLNNISVGSLQSEEDFLVVRKAESPEGEDHNIDSGLFYIRKTSILFIKETKQNRNLINQEQNNRDIYIHQDRLPVRMKCRIPGYILTGNIYFNKNRELGEPIRKEREFLPMTEVSIDYLPDKIKSAAEFIALNKNQILYMEDSNHN